MADAFFMAMVSHSVCTRKDSLPYLSRSSWNLSFVGVKTVPRNPMSRRIRNASFRQSLE